MSRTQNLNELFAEWKQRRGEEAECMCLDGIICVVTKEPNHPEGPGFDFREAFCKEVMYAFSIRLCEWA